MSALLINDVPIECINNAAITYHVPAALIISVLNTEGGKNGMAKPNANGTYDYGPMQINTVWLDVIEQYGFNKQDIQYNPCVNVEVGTWILATQIANADAIGRGIGDYHSHTPDKNTHYQALVLSKYNSLMNYLNSSHMPINKPQENVAAVYPAQTFVKSD